MAILTNRKPRSVKIRRVMVTATAALLIPLGMVACAVGDNYETTTVAEDCDLDDQDAREDDCGYWQRGAEYRTGKQPDITWLWIWYSWVNVGQVSTPPAGWTPPKGIKFPTKTVRVDRKNCAIGPFSLAVAPPAPPRPAAPPPAPPKPVNPGVKPPAGGGGKAPAGNAPKAPVYKPPAGQKVKC